MTVALIKPAQWHEDRRSGIGASDAPIVAGYGFINRYALWELKTGRREPEDLSEDPKVRWGTLLEDPVAENVKLRHPEWRVRRRNRTVRSDVYPWAFANLDREATVNGVVVPLEIKTAEREGEWGADGSADIPYYHFPQIQHQLAITEAPFAIVAVLIGGNDDRIYTVPRNDAYIAQLMSDELDFWTCVEDDVPPAPMNAEEVTARYPKPKGTREIGADLVARFVEYKTLSARITALTNQKDAMRDELSLVFGECEAVVANGKLIATFKGQDRKGFNLAAFQLEHPDLFEKFKTTSTVRTLLAKVAAKESF